MGRRSQVNFADATVVADGVKVKVSGTDGKKVEVIEITVNGVKKGASGTENWETEDPTAVFTSATVDQTGTVNVNTGDQTKVEITVNGVTYEGGSTWNDVKGKEDDTTKKTLEVNANGPLIGLVAGMAVGLYIGTFVGLLIGAADPQFSVKGPMFAGAFFGSFLGLWTGEIVNGYLTWKDTKGNVKGAAKEWPALVDEARCGETERGVSGAEGD